MEIIFILFDVWFDTKNKHIWITAVKPSISVAFAYAQLCQVIAPNPHHNEYSGTGVQKKSEWAQ